MRQLRWAWRCRYDSRLSYDKPTLSISRIKTAICARFAASATNVKSLRNGSVEADLTRTGAGGAMLVDDDWRVDNDDDCCVVGEVMGAFMLEAMMWCFLL